MSLQTYFTKFHDNIKLTSATKKELSNKRDILIGILRDSGKLPSFEEFSQGSYGMFLGIKPADDEEYDIDVGLRFNVSKDDYRPLEIKDTIYEILKGHTEYGAKIRKPCVTVTYKKDGEKSYHVDLVTYSYEDKDDFDGQMYLAKGTDTSPEDEVLWEKADPVALLDYIRDTVQDESEREQFRRIVKYIKHWKKRKFSSSGHAEPPSIGITLLVLDNFVASDGDDLSALIHAVDAIKSEFHFEGVDNNRFMYSISYSLPDSLRVEPGNNVFEKMSLVQMTDFKDKIEKLSRDLLAVQGEADLVKQCEKLRNVFGDDFEAPEAKDVSKQQMNYIPRSTASGNEYGL